MSSASSPLALPKPTAQRSAVLHLLDVLGMPVLAILTAFVLGGVVIALTSGKLETVPAAFEGLLRGAFLQPRALSETLVATVPYIFLALGVAVGFKTGLFNIGVEGQFYMGAVTVAWFGTAFPGLPAVVYLPATLLAGAIGGGIWAGIPGFLKAKTGAHEVISTMMLNYVAFRFVEWMVSGPLRNRRSTAWQTNGVEPGAQIWPLFSIPQQLRDPLNALLVALVLALVAFVIVRAIVGRRRAVDGRPGMRPLPIAAAVVIGIVMFFALPPLTQAWWPFSDKYDRLHIGLLLGIGMAVAVWWLLWKTTTGFEMRTVGANPAAARYAGVNITRNIVLAMFISGALAGIAGSIEVLGVSACRCLPMVFVSGYGFDSIAIALLGKNNPFGILGAAFLFGAMRNGQDFMELNSGVSKYVISVLQAFVLLFVAAPAIVRWIYRIKGKAGENEAPLTRGWGGG